MPARIALSSLLVLLTVIVLTGAGASEACVVEQRAAIPLQVNGGMMTVPVAVNGVDATFILDTGAGRSLLTEAAALRLGLERDQWVGTTLSGVGGIARRPNANPRSLSLGGVPLVRRTTTHDISLAVGVVPPMGAAEWVFDGLLGRDFLSLFDLDIDMPRRQLTLYHVKDCAGRFLPWTAGYTGFPVIITVPTAQAIVLPVTLDGTRLSALLDTGAAGSILAATGMVRLGLNVSAIVNDPAGEIIGVGARRVVVHRHRFRTLRVGATTTVSPQLWVEPIRLTPIVDMLLGADWLAGRHIWISYATAQVFLAAPGEASSPGSRQLER